MKLHNITCTSISSYKVKKKKKVTFVGPIRLADKRLIQYMYTHTYTHN